MTNPEKKLLLDCLKSLRCANIESASVLDELGGTAFHAFDRLQRANEISGKTIDALITLLLP